MLKFSNDFTISINQVITVDISFMITPTTKKNSNAVIKHVKFNHIGNQKSLSHS